MTDDVHRAERAHMLLNDEVFAEALTQIRTEALHSLGDIDPTNANEIRRLQAIVYVTWGIREKLRAMIIKTGAHDGGLTFPATGKANTAT